MSITPTSFTISLPMVLQLGTRKKKNYWLTLNNYRNWQYIVNNNLKKKFKEEITPLLPTGVKYDKFYLHYTMYPPDNRQRDINNVCSTIDKFFADALVAAGLVPDDNMNHLLKCIYEVGEVDPDNPRVEVTVEKAESKETSKT